MLKWDMPVGEFQWIPSGENYGRGADKLASHWSSCDHNSISACMPMRKSLNSKTHCPHYHKVICEQLWKDKPKFIYALAKVFRSTRWETLRAPLLWCHILTTRWGIAACLSWHCKLTHLGFSLRKLESGIFIRTHKLRLLWPFCSLTNYFKI